jgi:hypothetical protein
LKQKPDTINTAEQKNNFGNNSANGPKLKLNGNLLTALAALDKALQQSTSSDVENSKRIGLFNEGCRYYSHSYTPTLWHPPWLYQNLLSKVLYFILYPMVFTGILVVVAICQIWTFVQSAPNFFLILEEYNKIGYQNLLYPFYVLDSKRNRHIQHLRGRLRLCALECNVFMEVINLDKYNLFLLGILFQG